MPNMGDQKKKGILERLFSSTSGSGDQKLAHAPGCLASEQSEPEQSSGEQKPQQAAPFPPATSRGSGFRNWLGRETGLGQRSPSPLFGRRRSKTPDPGIAAPSSESLAVPASVRARPHSSYSSSSPPSLVPASAPARPHSLYSDSPAPQTHGLSLDVALSPTGSTSSGAQGPSTIPVSAPMIQISNSELASENLAPPSTSPHHSTTTCLVQTSAEIDVHAIVLPEMKSAPDSDGIEPSSQVWAKALEIARKKLGDNNLPPPNLTNLISQSAEENMEAIVKALNTAQEDHKKQRWRYTGRLGKILKSVETYTKVVDTAIQSNPQVSALVWAGMRAGMQVRIDVLFLHVDSPRLSLLTE